MQDIIIGSSINHTKTLKLLSGLPCQHVQHYKNYEFSFNSLGLLNDKWWKHFLYALLLSITQTLFNTKDCYYLCKSKKNKTIKQQHTAAFRSSDIKLQSTEIKGVCQILWKLNFSKEKTYLKFKAADLQYCWLQILTFTGITKYFNFQYSSSLNDSVSFHSIQLYRFNWIQIPT